MCYRTSLLAPAWCSLALWLTAASSAVAAAPLAGADSPAAPWPTTSWPVSSPAEQGLDADRLDELVRLIGEGERFPDLHSLLVARNGYLVLEEYFAGYDADDLHMLQTGARASPQPSSGLPSSRD